MNAADLKAGDKYEMAWPFHFEQLTTNSNFGWGSDDYWVGGCKVDVEQHSEWESERFFTAHGEGKVIYEILSIAEMPGRYMDRVIFKRSTIDPEGDTANPGEIKMLTVRKFIKDITSRTPFPVNYELEEVA